MAAETVVVLAVDDDERYLNLLRLAFCFTPVTVLTTTSPRTAMGMLETIDGIGLVLSDWHMPELNGVQFLRNVEESCPEILRVLMSTALDFDEVLQPIEQGTIARCFEKPTDLEALRVTVLSLVKLLAGRVA